MHMLNADALTGQGLIVSLVLTGKLVASGGLERQLTVAMVLLNNLIASV